MSFSGLFQTQGMLFLLLLIGYIFGKKGLADGTGKNLLTDLVIYVTLPGSIIKSFQIEFNHQILIACMTIAILFLECFFIITMETAKRKCCSMPPSVPMREFWEILSRKGFSDRWE